jgi:F0F1-type ATP synthase alpha subunit
VFAWKSEDERHFQSEFKKRRFTSTEQIQALCGQNAILQAEVRRLELEKAALIKRLPLERKHVQLVSANDFPLIEVGNEIQQLGEAVAALGIEKRLIDSKIKTLEARLAREKLIAETQNSLVKLAIENEVHCRLR